MENCLPVCNEKNIKEACMNENGNHPTHIVALEVNGTKMFYRMVKNGSKLFTDQFIIHLKFLSRLKRVNISLLFLS